MILIVVVLTIDPKVLCQDLLKNVVYNQTNESHKVLSMFFFLLLAKATHLFTVPV